jgi:hypothetical protein
MSDIGVDLFVRNISLMLTIKAITSKQPTKHRDRIMDQDTISTKQYTLVVVGFQCP